MIDNLPAHMPIVDPSHLESIITPSSKIIYAQLPLLYLGAMFPKLSLLSTYLRIFPGQSMRITVYITLALVVS